MNVIFRNTYRRQRHVRRQTVRRAASRVAGFSHWTINDYVKQNKHPGVTDGWATLQHYSNLRWRSDANCCSSSRAGTRLANPSDRARRTPSPACDSSGATARPAPDSRNTQTKPGFKFNYDDFADMNKLISLRTKCCSICLMRNPSHQK